MGRAGSARDVSGSRLQAMQPTTERADPEAATLILGEGPDIIPAQALGLVGVAVDGKGAARRIEAIEAAAGGGDPQRAGAVQVEISNGVMAEALRVGGIVPIGGEGAARRVEPVQAAAVGADPQRARLVLLQRSNPRVAQTLGVRGSGG